MELPERGQSWAELSKGMEDAGKHDVAWRDGKAAVYVFNACLLYTSPSPRDS